ncbi:MAG: hypothetical protein ABI137_09930, partial [Antricoccus sp.]
MLTPTPSPRTSNAPITAPRRYRRSGKSYAATLMIIEQPKKRPRSFYLRFEADLPNETWQSDFTHWRLADDTGIEILTFGDDHSRKALSISAYRVV